MVNHTRYHTYDHSVRYENNNFDWYVSLIDKEMIKYGIPILELPDTCISKVAWNKLNCYIVINSQ